MMLPDFLKSSLLESEDKSKKKYRLQLLGINNKDGTLRWLYPSSSSTPTFLKFYNQSSIKAFIFSAAIRVLFEFGLANLIAKVKIDCEFFEKSVLHYLLEKYKPSSYSIFLGTVGENRKILFEALGEEFGQVFVKISISEKSKNLIQNEAATIARLDAYDFRILKTPKVINLDKRGFVELSNIKPKYAKQPSDFRNVHGEVLNELYSTGVSSCRVERREYLDQLERLEVRISMAENSNRQNGGYPFLELISKIKSVINALSDGANIYYGTGHGDYTPWNSFMSRNSVYVLDWELSEPNLPLLYDFFHFIVQSEVLIKNNEYGLVLTKVAAARRLRSIALIEAKYNVDFNSQFVAYLLKVTVFHIDIYSLQPNLHFQGRRLLDFWRKGMEHFLEKKGNIF